MASLKPCESSWADRTLWGAIDGYANKVINHHDWGFECAGLTVDHAPSPRNCNKRSLSIVAI